MQRSDAPVGGFSLLLDPLKKVLDEPRLHEVLKAIEEDEKHGIHLDPKTDVHEYMRQRKQRQQHLGSLYQRIARYLARPQRMPSPRRRPSLKALEHFADMWPLGLRKRMKALAGDYDADIRALHKQHRYRMAKWNKFLAWGHAWWYVLRGPCDAALTWAVKAWRGL